MEKIESLLFEKVKDSVEVTRNGKEFGIAVKYRGRAHITTHNVDDWMKIDRDEKDIILTLCDIIIGEEEIIGE